MRCSICEKAGIKHTVYGEHRSAAAPFWDENGKHHKHNPFSQSTDYTCSNGHKFSEIKYGHCWCGWPGGNTRIVKRRGK